MTVLQRCAAAAAVMAVSLGLGGCGGRRVVFTAGPAGDTLFTVGSAAASTAEFKVYNTTLQREYEQTFGSGIWTNAGNETLPAAVRDNALARLTKVKVLQLMAQEDGVLLEEQDQTLAREAGQGYYGSLNAAERTYFGLDENDCASMYQEYARAEKEYEHILESVDQEVSDDEARTVTCQQILIRGTDAEAKSRADAILKEIRDGIANLTGVPFTSYVAEYNEGDTSEITVTRDEPDTALQEAAFALGEGKISEVTATEDGYRILKCISASDEEQTNLNKERILRERQQAAFESAYDSYVENLDYWLDEDKYAQMTLVTDPEVTTDTFFSTYATYFD